MDLYARSLMPCPWKVDGVDERARKIESWNVQVDFFVGKVFQPIKRSFIRGSTLRSPSSLVLLATKIWIGRDRLLR